MNCKTPSKVLSKSDARPACWAYATAGSRAAHVRGAATPITRRRLSWFIPGEPGSPGCEQSELPSNEACEGPLSERGVPAPRGRPHPGLQVTGTAVRPASAPTFDRWRNRGRAVTKPCRPTHRPAAQPPRGLTPQSPCWVTSERQPPPARYRTFRGRVLKCCFYTRICRMLWCLGELLRSLGVQTL